MAKGVKCKKRNTRKCLDKIRNRSKRKSENLSDSHKYLEHKIKNTFVTSERLTLQTVFRKVIHSETITRPVLAQLKKNHSKIDDKFFKAKLMISPIMKRLPHSDLLTISSNKSKSDNNPSSSSEILYESNHCIEEISTKLSKSPILFVSNSTEESDFLENKTRTLRKMPSQSLSQECRFHPEAIYNNFLNDVSSLIKLGSSINQGDEIEDSDEELKMLCVKRNQLNYKNIHSSMNDRKIKIDESLHSNINIIDNPRDYLRSKQTKGKHNDWSQQHSPDISPYSAITHVNALLVEPVRSAVSSWSSPFAATDASHASPHCTEAPFEPPEYNYYPHRLIDYNK